MEVGAIVAGIAAAIALGLAADVFRRFTRTSNRLETVAGQIEEIERELEQRPDSTRAESPLPQTLVPLFFDREMFEDIARQHGVQVDTVLLEESEHEQATAEVNAGVSARVDLPATRIDASAKSRLAQTQGRRRGTQTEIRYNPRKAFVDLVDALEESGSLDRDLAKLPDGVELAVRLATHIGLARVFWNIEGSGDDDEQELPFDLESAAEEEVLPTDVARNKLGFAFDAVEHRAKLEVDQAKSNELIGIGKSAASGRETMFALIEAEWDIVDTLGGLILWNTQLYENPRDIDSSFSFYSFGHLQVRVDDRHLTSWGRSRLVPKGSGVFRVLGFIEGWNEPLRELRVVPLFISN